MSLCIWLKRWLRVPEPSVGMAPSLPVPKEILNRGRFLTTLMRSPTGFAPPRGVFILEGKGYKSRRICSLRYRGIVSVTYVRNAWYVAAWAHELRDELPLGVRVLDEPIVIWRNGRGDLAAFEDYCLHRLARLSLGRCEGERLRCMYHGWLYDSTGHVV